MAALLSRLQHCLKELPFDASKNYQKTLRFRSPEDIAFVRICKEMPSLIIGEAEGGKMKCS